MHEGAELHSLRPSVPLVHVAVDVHKVDAELGGESLILLLADLVPDETGNQRGQ
jgi:hypothetical protein